MKGRKTTCVTLRLSDDIVKSLEEKARKQGLATAGQYIKAQILKSFNSNRSEITIAPEPIKDVLADREGRKYKVIGGVRYILHNNHSASQ